MQLHLDRAHELNLESTGKLKSFGACLNEQTKMIGTAVLGNQPRL